MQIRATGADITSVPASSSRNFKRKLEPWLYLAPGLLIFTAFMAIPTVGTVILSLTNWDGVGWNTATFIGVDNYRRAITDPAFRNAFWN